VSRLRAGEWVAALGAGGLLIVLFADWFSISGRKAGWTGYTPLHGTLHEAGWTSLGWLMSALLVIAIAGGLSLSYMTVKRASPAWPVGAGVLTWVGGSLIFLILLVRVTIAQPGLGIGLRDAAVGVELPAYAGLCFAFLIPLGAFFSLHDERTQSAEALAYTLPPARTAPGT
jgi:hypothetical protein